MAVLARDPRVTAPPGAYLTDGIRLMWVLLSDRTGVWVEDCATFATFELRPRVLAEKWARVFPDNPAEKYG